ncbi:hypothetical protein [Streptomyces sp. NPDC047928]|uniref:hypothetical protein n=1 Tax=unclassified Streptomyces TaxID=2593676 RepID=UPI003718EEBE
MSGGAPVDPAEIPVFTGDLETLDTKVKALSGQGAKIVTAAGDVHTTFGGLRAFYQAPEAEQLFATTQPVKDKALVVSSDMCVIAGALGTYANDVRPLVERLKELKREAEAFRTKVADDDKWREDGDLIDENLERRNKIAEVWSAFQEAERAAHAKIVALVGGDPLKVNDGSNQEGMYGYDAEALKQSKSLPWGEAVQESTPWWQVWEHAWDFGKGVIVDGVWGTIKGLGTLVGFEGWDAMKQAWTGLAKLATGLAITAIPGVGAAYWMMPEDKLPSWLRDSRTAVKETGKALLAWDQWGENPARAAGAVTFNVLTTVFTGGAGGAAAGAGKAGAVAKALSFAGKTGRAIDPATYLFQGAGASVSKIGDVMAGLKGMGDIKLPDIPVGTIELPQGALKLPDGTLHLPDGAPVPAGAIEVPQGTVRLPEGTPVPAGAVDLGDGMVKLPEGTPAPAGSTAVPEGTVKAPEGVAALPPGTSALPDVGDSPARYIDEAGNLYKEDGSLFQRGDEARKENPNPDANAHADGPTHAPDPAKAPTKVPAMAGANVADNAANAADDAAGTIRLGDSLADVGRVPDDLSGLTRPDTTPGAPGGLADNTPTSRTGGTAPGGTAGTHLPTNSLDNATGGTPRGGDTTPPPPGAAGHTDTPSSRGAATTHGDTPGTGGAHPPLGGHGPGGFDAIPGIGDDVARAGDEATPGGGHDGQTTQPAAGQQLTPEQVKAKQDEFVAKANDPDKTWFNQYYRSDGHRHSIQTKIDGVELPILAKDSDGAWISKNSLPSAGSETRFGREELGRKNTLPEIDHLDDVARDRKVSVELANAERAHKTSPSADTLDELAKAQERFDTRMTPRWGENTSNNTSFSERLGEDTARLHVIPEKFPGSVEQPLPKTPNGANMFDQLYRRPDGKLMIIEAKAPSSSLIWRKGVGPAAGFMVKQGTEPYLRTIIAEMELRPRLKVTDASGKVWTNAELADELTKALDSKNVEYAMVKAKDGGGKYAGAVIEFFKI